MSTGTIEWTAGINGGNIWSRAQQAIKVDNSNNVYTLHQTDNTTVRILNPDGQVATTITVSTNHSNIIVKRTSTGTYLGYYLATSANEVGFYPNGFDIDTSGAVYLVGFFYNNSVVTVRSSYTATTLSLTKSPTYDYMGYFIKWNSLGVPEFIFTPTNALASAPWGIKVDGSSVYIVCNTTWMSGGSSVLNSNGTQFRILPSHATSNEDALLIKYNLSGTVEWAFIIFSTTTLSERPYGIDLDSSGNIYVSGRFFPNNGTQTINNLFGTNSETSSGSTMSTGQNPSGFIIKYNSSGIHQWNVLIDGDSASGGDEILYFLTLKNNALYVPFYSNSSTVTVRRNGTQINSTSSQVNAGLMYKINLDGTFGWVVKTAPSTSTFAKFESVAVDELNRVYVGGRFDSSACVFTSTNNTTITFNRLTTSQTGFIIWLDQSGNYQNRNVFSNAEHGITYYNGKVYVNAQLTPSTTIYDTSGNSASTFGPNTTETTTNATFSIRANPTLNNWIARDISRNWYSIASSANGANLIACVYGGFLYTSVNGGISWTQRETSRNWSAVASSSTGGILYASVDNGHIYKSTDFGGTWTVMTTSLGTKKFAGLACSTDGSYVVAATTNDFLYVSINGGTSWSSTNISADYRAVAMSADGTRILAPAMGGYLWTGVYSSGTWIWTQRDSSRNWLSVASSADGTKLVAGVDNGQIYTSTNSGGSWSARDSNRTWRSLACSSDGSIIYAAVQGGGIYVSTNSGSTFALSSLPSGPQYVYITLSYDGLEAAVATYGGPIYTLDNTAPTPGAPLSLTATPGNAQVSLSWLPPYNSGTSPITSYRVERSTDNVNWLNGTSGTTFYNSTNLTNGTTYYYRVFATNANGTGPASNTVIVVPGSNPVTGLTASATGLTNTATVSWTAAAPKAGYDISSYTISWTTTDAASYVSPLEYNVDSTQGYYYTNFVDLSYSAGQAFAKTAPYNSKFGVPQYVDANSIQWANPTGTGGINFPNDSGITYYATNFVTTFEMTYSGLIYNTGFSMRINANDSRYYLVGQGPDWGNTFRIYGPDSSGNIVTIFNLDSSGGTSSLGGTLGIYRRLNGFTVYRFNGNVYNQLFDISGITWVNTTNNNFGIGATYRIPFITMNSIKEYPLPQWPGFGLDLSGTITTTSVSQVINTLANNVNYTISVVANSALGSSAVTTTTIRPYKIAKPISLKARNGVNLLNARWLRPFQTRNLSNYTVSWTNGTVSGSAITSNATPIDISYNITSIPNDGTTYTITVAANYTDGSSGSQTTITSINAPTISNLQATPLNNQLNLSWTRPTDISGYPTTSYRVSWSDGSASTVDTSYNIIGLTNGTNYTISVSAISSLGTSAVVSITAKPYTTPSQISLVTLTTGNAFIDLSWNAPNNGGADISSYRVERSTDASNWIVDVSSNATTSYRSTGLVNGTTYYYRIYARNIAGFSTASTTVSGTPSNAPSAPSGLTATAGVGQVLLSWNVPYNGGSNILDYRIEKSLDNSSWSVDISNYPDISYTVVELTNATLYYFRVYARNINGTSLPSLTVSATPRTVPSMITSVTLTPSATSIDISWNAPDNGGSTITGYLIERSSDLITWTVDVSSNPTTTYTSTGLNRGARYYYRIYARNAAGLGIVSNPVSTITISVPHAPTITNLVPGNSSITIFYDQSNNILPRITKYRYTTNGTTFTERLADEIDSPWFIHNLNNGISYNVQIAAYNENGWSSLSNQTTASPVDNRSATFKNAISTLTTNNITTVTNTILSDISSQTVVQARQLIFNMAQDISNQTEEVKKGTLLATSMKLNSTINDIKSDINQQLVEYGITRNVPFEIADQTIVSQIIDISTFKVPSWTPTTLSVIVPTVDDTITAQLDLSNILLTLVPDVSYNFTATYNGQSSSTFYSIVYKRTDVSRYIMVDSTTLGLGQSLVFTFPGNLPRTFTFNIFGNPGGESGTGSSGGYGDPKIVTVNKDFYYLPYDENCYLLYDNQDPNERVILSVKCWFLSEEAKHKSNFTNALLDEKTFFRYLNIHYMGENLTIDMESLKPVEYTNMDDVNTFSLNQTKVIPQNIKLSDFINDTEVFKNNYKAIKIKMYNIQFNGKSRIIKLGNDYEFKLSFDLNCADHRNAISIIKANYNNSIGALINKNTAFTLDNLIPK